MHSIVQTMITSVHARSHRDTINKCNEFSLPRQARRRLYCLGVAVVRSDNK